jgi:hypothetical protein
MVGIIHSVLYVQQSSMTRQPNNSTSIPKGQVILCLGSR